MLSFYKKLPLGTLSISKLYLLVLYAVITTLGGDPEFYRRIGW